MSKTIPADEAKLTVHSEPIKRGRSAEAFTLSQIHDSHSKMKNGAGFPAFARALMSLGVTGFELFVDDRRASYFGKNGFSIKEEAKYPSFAVSPKVDSERLGSFLKTYHSGRTNYMTFCEQIANAGIEKWTLNVKKMTCTYYDAQGVAVLIEQVPAG